MPLVELNQDPLSYSFLSRYMFSKRQLIRSIGFFKFTKKKLEEEVSMKVGSFFSGAGGLDFGFRNAGYSLSWASDIEKSFCESYSQLCETQSTIGDFWDIKNSFSDVDVVIGGPPCQSFSLVGKRLEDDPRGKLVAGFKEYIEDRLPRAFVLENVPGLAASKFNGNPLPSYLVSEFERMGYTVRLGKLDASEYLVPQKRKRIIIFGVRNPSAELKFISPKDFAFEVSKRSGISIKNAVVGSRAAFAGLPKPYAKSELRGEYLASPNSEYADLMRLKGPEFVTLHNVPTMSKLDEEFVKHIPPGGNFLSIPDEISTMRILKFKQSGGRTTTYARLHPENPSYTVNTYFNRPNVGSNYHFEENRLITVREAMRLQSFPDFFVPKYKNQRELHIQVGNAVPPLLAEAIAYSLQRSL